LSNVKIEVTLYLFYLNLSHKIFLIFFILRVLAKFNNFDKLSFQLIFRINSIFEHYEHEILFFAIPE